jgi:hypothetical protein
MAFGSHLLEGNLLAAEGYKPQALRQEHFFDLAS